MDRYELPKEYRELESLYKEEKLNVEGIKEFFEEKQTKEDLKTRVENICKLIKEYEAEIKKMEGFRQDLRNYIKHEMEINNFKKVNGDLMNVLIVENPKLLLDEDILPKEFMKLVADNKKIRQALYNNETVEGAKFEKNSQLRITRKTKKLPK